MERAKQQLLKLIQALLKGCGPRGSYSSHLKPYSKHTQAEHEIEDGQALE